MPAKRCSGQTHYDKEYEFLIVTWNITTAYDDECENHMFKVKQGINKMTVTIQINLKLSSFDKCSSINIRNRNQTYHWRISVFNAFQNDGNKKADIPY